jgi:hypothetical protein
MGQAASVIEQTAADWAAARFGASATADAASASSARVPVAMRIRRIEAPPDDANGWTVRPRRAPRSERISR